jgi:tRNA threonylcarbamoyladenosine biosynthesis protein TsaE
MGEAPASPLFFSVVNFVRRVGLAPPILRRIVRYNPPVTHTSRSVPETESIAAQLAATLQSGDLLALEGQLGAGKTQFVRGLVRALGGDGKQVSSPTFILLNVYETPRFPVYHLDAYRVQSGEDFSAIGFSELLEQNGLVVVEWPSRVEEILPPTRINIQIEITGKTTRQITISRPT